MSAFPSLSLSICFSDNYCNFLYQLLLLVFSFFSFSLWFITDATQISLFLLQLAFPLPVGSVADERSAILATIDFSLLKLSFIFPSSSSFSFGTITFSSVIEFHLASRKSTCRDLWIASRGLVSAPPSLTDSIHHRIIFFFVFYFCGSSMGVLNFRYLLVFGLVLVSL